MSRNILIPPEVSGVLQRLNGAGFAAYAVGGCVRDSLLGLHPQDWDLCTAARPAQVAACFPDDRVLRTGERFGTVTLLREGASYEITTFRAEVGYSDARHPDAVAFLPELAGDLARRDFTVNAMAADAQGRVTDLFGGVGDLQQGIIRCVGEPKARFEEDALRILRGLRFAARLDFVLESQTAEAIHVSRERLGLVAPERLAKELTGLVCGRAAGRVLREFGDVVAAVIPELKASLGFCQYNFHHVYDVWTHTCMALDQAPQEPLLRLAVLLHDVGKPGCFTIDKNLVGHFYGHAIAGSYLTRKILQRLRYDRKTVEAVTQLVRLHDRQMPDTERAMGRLVSQIGPEQARRLFYLRCADRSGKGTGDEAAAREDLRKTEALLDQVLASGACLQMRDLAIGGKELMALGIPQGPRIGRMLQRLFEEVVEGRLPNHQEQLLAFVKKDLKSDGCSMGKP